MIYGCLKADYWSFIIQITDVFGTDIIHNLYNALYNTMAVTTTLRMDVVLYNEMDNRMYNVLYMGLDDVLVVAASILMYNRMYNGMYNTMAVLLYNILYNERSGDIFCFTR